VAASRTACSNTCEVRKAMKNANHMSDNGNNISAVLVMRVLLFTTSLMLQPMSVTTGKQ